MSTKFWTRVALTGIAVTLPFAATAHNGSPVTPVPALAPQPVEAAANPDGIARWQLGAPGTARFNNGPITVESLTANGVTVQVSLQDTGWKLRATVAIANASDAQVHFNPSTFTLDELTPRLRALPHQNLLELSRSLHHEPSSDGASAIAPPSATYANASYKTSVTSSASPNYLAQDSLQQSPSVLHSQTLAPNAKTAGVVWFQRAKNSRQLNLRIFVDNQIFEFPLSFPQHN
jgi:hypothetical protein